MEPTPANTTSSCESFSLQVHLKAPQTSQLLLLPREIRDQILNQLLLSPTGLIGFEWVRKPHPTDNPSHHSRFEIHATRNAGSKIIKHGQGGRSTLQFARLREIRAKTRIELSLLQVCWQLHSECAPIIWGQNGVDLGRPKLVGKYYRGWEVGPRPYVQHVALEYSMTRTPDHARYPKHSWIVPLAELQCWGQYGSLKSVTLHIIAGGVYGLHADYIWLKKKMLLYDENRAVCFEEDLYEVWLKELRKAKTDQYLLGLDIKIVARTGYDTLSRSVLLYRMYHAPFDPNLHFRELSEAVGRELWVDGDLCYNNGKEIKVPFPQYYEAKKHLTMPLEVSIARYLDSIGEKRDAMAMLWP